MIVAKGSATADHQHRSHCRMAPRGAAFLAAVMGPASLRARIWPRITRISCAPERPGCTTPLEAAPPRTTALPRAASVPDSGGWTLATPTCPSLIGRIRDAGPAQHGCCSYSAPSNIESRDSWLNPSSSTSVCSGVIKRKRSSNWCRLARVGRKSTSFIRHCAQGSSLGRW